MEGYFLGKINHDLVRRKDGDFGLCDEKVCDLCQSDTIVRIYVDDTSIMRDKDIVQGE